MTQYLVAIHHPDNYDPSKEGEAMIRDIDVLNEEMEAAGARFFAGGLSAPSRAKSLGAARWKGAYHRRAVPGDQGAHRRFLDTGSCRHGRGTGVGAQGCHRLPGAGRGAPIFGAGLTAGSATRLLLQ